MKRLRHVWPFGFLVPASLWLALIAPPASVPFMWAVFGAIAGMGFSTTAFVLSDYGRLRFPD